MGWLWKWWWLILLLPLGDGGTSWADNSPQTAAGKTLLKSLDRPWIVPLWVKSPDFDKTRRKTWGEKSDSGDAAAASPDGSTSDSDPSMNKSLGGLLRKAADTRQLVMDNSQKKGGGPNDQIDSDRGGRVSTPPAASGSGTVTYPLWYPMCIFVDPSIPNGNDLVKGQVENAAKCKVNLAVWAITIKSNYSPDPNEINSRQQASCNLGDILGVPQWSTQVAGKYINSPQLMCDAWKKGPQGEKIPDLEVAGCAQLCGKSGLSSNFLKGQQGSYGMGGPASGGAIPDILQPGAGAGVGTHEAIGHSEMCWPNMDHLEGQLDAGLGIGTPPKGSTARLDRIVDELYGLAGLERPPSPIFPSDSGGVAAGPEGGGLDGSFNEIGCAQFRANAYPNDGTWRYDPQQQYYYAAENDPERQWNLSDPLFNKPGAPPPNPPPRFINDPRPDEKQLVFEDDLPKLSADKGEPPPDSGDARHKKKKPPVDNLSAAWDAAVAGLRQMMSDKRSSVPDPIEKEKFVPPMKEGGSSDPTELVFDDASKKAPDDSSRSEKNTGDGASSGGNSSGGGGGDASQLVFDDNAPKGEAAEGGGSGGSTGSAGNLSDQPARDTASLGMAPGASAGSGLGNGETVTLSPEGTRSELDDDFFNKPPKEDPSPKGRVRGSGLRRKKEN